MLKDKSALGQTGLEVSPLCLGCGSYGGSMKEPLAVEMMDDYYGRSIFGYGRYLLRLV